MELRSVADFELYLKAESDEAHTAKLSQSYLSLIALFFSPARQYWTRLRTRENAKAGVKSVRTTRDKKKTSAPVEAGVNEHILQQREDKCCNAFG